MNKSESVKAIAEALAKAQAEMPAVKFNKINPFLKNNYADLGAIIETAQPILAKHNLAVSQLTYSEDDKIGVETVLFHSSGEFIGSTLSMATEVEKGKSSAQVAGSIITYIRRYALAAILGMYADEDGDGNSVKTPPPLPPVAKSEPIAEPEPADLMTIEQAAIVTNSEGVKYLDLGVEKLASMSIGINKALKKTDLSADARGEYQHKLQAIGVLLKAKKDGSIK